MLRSNPAIIKAFFPFFDINLIPMIVPDKGRIICNVPNPMTNGGNNFIDVGIHE
jgi:hypothetical protein